MYQFSREVAARASQQISRYVARDYRALVSALETQVFPVVVVYATHPLIILVTILLLAPLILDSQNTALALALGNYTNVVSAAVSSIVLATSLKQHQENKRLHAENRQLHEQHASDLQALHEKVEALKPRRARTVTTAPTATTPTKAH